MSTASNSWGDVGRYSMTVVVRIVSGWASALLDSLLGYVIGLCYLLFIASASRGTVGVDTLIAYINITNQTIFYAICAALVLSSIIQTVGRQANWFNSDSEQPKDSPESWSGFLKQTIFNVSASFYRATVVFGTALAATHLNSIGLTVIAGWALLFIPAFELYTYQKLEVSLLSPVAFVILGLLFVFVYPAALARYLIWRSGTAREQAVELLVSYLRLVGAGSRPIGGSLLDEFGLIMLTLRHRGF